MTLAHTGNCTFAFKHLIILKCTETNPMGINEANLRTKMMFHFSVLISLPDEK
jgi:hypothetical protein